MDFYIDSVNIYKLGLKQQTVMKILALSDWRVQPIEDIFEFIDDYKRPIDAIVYAGDDIRRFQDEWKNYFAELAQRTKRKRVFGVIGNDDTPDVREILNRGGVYDVHKKGPVVLGSYAFLGLEGAPRTLADGRPGIGIVLYSEDEAFRHLSKQYNSPQSKGKKKILISHAPPNGILDLSVRFGIGHIGSKAVLKFIKEKEIEFVICGHSHLHGMQVAKQGKTLVVNIASHDDEGAPGRFAIIDLDSKDVQFYDTSMLASNSELNKLQQIGWNRIKHLRKLGITKLTDITEKNRELLKKAPGVYDWHVDRWLEQVQAIHSGKLILRNHPILERIMNDEIICYDIETDLACGRVWLIGLYNFKENKFIQYFEPDDEKVLLRKFNSYINKYSDYTLISCSNCRFEQRVLERSFYNHKLVCDAIKNEVDLGICLPDFLLGDFKQFNLKVMGNRFGFAWKNPSITGFYVGMAYTEYLLSKKKPNWKELKQYNKDDVCALKTIIEHIRKLKK